MNSRRFLSFLSPRLLSCPPFPQKSRQPCPKCCAPPPRSRKPRSHWHNLENLKHELESLQKSLPSLSPNVMPTSAQLRAVGRTDLHSAISNLGGYVKLASHFGWARRAKRRPNGYWSDFNNVKRELLQFVHDHSVDLPAGTMPTQKQFRHHKRSDLADALASHGGSVNVAKKLGWTSKGGKGKHYWKDWGRVESEVRRFVEMRQKTKIGSSEKRLTTCKAKNVRMPSQKELREAGRADLAEAISDFHGGFRAVAKKLGYVSKKKGDFFYSQFYNLAKEVYAFARQLGQPAVMPTTASLRAQARGDIAAATVKFGGMAEVAQRLGLQYRVRTRETFKNWYLFRDSLIAFVRIHGTPGAMPSSRKLRNFGRTDLYRAILHHGGYREVANRLGLQCSYWEDFYEVGYELLSFIDKHGTEGVMPTEREIEDIGRTSLNLAVSKFGYSLTAKRLGLTETSLSPQTALDAFLSKSLSLTSTCSSDSGANYPSDMASFDLSRLYEDVDQD
eukprot:GFKZ01007229.1.p1 GENE.GFKZ01007229.1~~GFKZ01007229.1.p1  ORF type:complete len:503 (-),score=60.87 GFKZ01007229.1:796-2304(-)